MSDPDLQNSDEDKPGSFWLFLTSMAILCFIGWALIVLLVYGLGQFVHFVLDALGVL